MIKGVGIVGAGTMGRDIAQVCAMAGLDVALVDVSAEALEQSISTLRSRYDRHVARLQSRTSSSVSWLERITPSQSYTPLATADLVIESATEKADAKAHILRKIDSVVGDSTIVATNTSSMSIGQLALVVRHPQKFLGLHFFNPATAMTLVEIVRSEHTSAFTVDCITQLTKVLGKQPVFVKDSPGFVVNRLLCPMINEAVLLLQEGVASAEDIDSAMQLGCRHPAGPLALADQIGLDVLLAIMDVFHDRLPGPKYQAAPLLRTLVGEGKLGRKTGQGFYSYPAAVRRAT
jgi:3-hydroxybutyryl-CoA dehydrogenase